MTDINKVLQSWVEDYVDVYNKQPSKETLERWRFQISEASWNTNDYEDDE